MATAPTLQISVFWHPDRKCWRIMGLYQGRTVVVKDYEPAMLGAPSPADLRQLIDALCVEADRWLW